VDKKWQTQPIEVHGFASNLPQKRFGLSINGDGIGLLGKHSSIHSNDFVGHIARLHHPDDRLCDVIWGTEATNWDFWVPLE
jgi:hypothetical protein